MPVERRILGNSALLGALEGAGQVVNLAIAVLLARSYGVEALGAYSFAMALGFLLANVGALGATSYATREIALVPDRAPALLAAIWPAQLVGALCGAAALSTWALLLADDRAQSSAVVAIALSQLVTRLGGLYVAPLIARERFGRAAWLGLSERVVGLGLFSAAVAADARFATAALALPAAAATYLAAAWGLAHRQLPRPWPAVNVARTIAAIRASLPFLWTTVVATLYQRGGLLILTVLGGTLAAGTFAAGERLLVPCSMLYGTFASAAFPAFTRLADDAARLRELVARCLRIILLATLGLATLIALLAPGLVEAVWDRPVPEAVPVLRVLAASVALRSIAAMLSIHCQAIRAEGDAARARVTALIAFAILGIPAAHYAGALGLAATISLSDLFLVTRLAMVLRRRGQLSLPLKSLARPLAAVLATTATLSLAPPLTFMLEAALSAGVLALAMLASGSIRPHDFRFLLALFQGRSRG